jgi:imidazolonepropionase-like amidohydrolase
MRTILSLLLASLTLLGISEANAQSVIIKAGYLVDVATGTITENQSILITDGKVAAIGDMVVAPDGTPVLDL